MAITDTFSVMFENMSAFCKLLRVATHCLRFVKNSTVSKSLGNLETLTNVEIVEANLRLIKTVQMNHFSNEIKCLRTSQSIKKSSKLVRLNSF